MAGKRHRVGQAKTLTAQQIKAISAYIREHHRHGTRDLAMFLLSMRAGLRAVEISRVRWSMATGADGQVGDELALPRAATKGGYGARAIPLNRDLRAALVALHAERQPGPDDPIIYSERGRAMSRQGVVDWFANLYRRIGLDGCSSHSGRRSFITLAARRCIEAGGSLRDVQQLAGHSSLATTQRYIEGSTEAKRRLVNLI